GSGSPDHIVFGNGYVDVKIIKVIVEFLGSVVVKGIPAINIVIYGDPRKEIGDKISAFIYFSGSIVRGFIEFVRPFYRNVCFLAGFNGGDGNIHIGGLYIDGVRVFWSCVDPDTFYLNPIG